jgi:hypothetical protein
VRGIFQGQHQRAQNTIQILQHVIVPEPHHAKIVFSQPTVTHNVPLGVGMLAAIDLDYEP